MYRTATKSALSDVRVAVCGHLPTAYDYLLGLGVVHIDQYTDAVNLHHDSYDLILVYAPQGEGLTEVTYPYKVQLQGDWQTVPIRMLGEPACTSALSELCEAVHAMAGVPPGRPAV